jgi:hypothetical protein
MTRLLVPVLSAALFGAASASAQTSTPPAHISVVEGTATVDREIGSETAVADLPLVTGDRVRTSRGRAEILLGDGSALHLDEQTTIDVNADAVVRLLGGRLVVLAEPGVSGALQIDTSPASVRLLSAGEARLSLLDDGNGVFLDVALVRGEAEVTNDGGAVTVGAGGRVIVRDGEAPSQAFAFNSAQLDAFYQWSGALIDSRRGTASAEYLPADLVTYGAALDQYGSWDYLAPYGYVWYPRVGAGWRPYSRGRWCWRGDGIGWTFVGGTSWTWPTHHYGRWGMTSAGDWYWIPRHGFSSAWVQWAVAPGYVSWCPLGGNNQPVVSFWAGRGGHAHGTPWRAWTVVDSGVFRRGSAVSIHPVDPGALRGPAAPAFVVQSAQPQIAVPRGVVASERVTAGAMAVPNANVRTRRGDDASPRGIPITRTPPPNAPAVVYYRGGMVTTGSATGDFSGSARGSTAVPRDASRGAMPYGSNVSHGSDVSHGPHVPRGVYAPHSAYVPHGISPMPPPRVASPPTPSLTGPPIIAVPRATLPGAGSHSVTTVPALPAPAPSPHPAGGSSSQGSSAKGSSSQGTATPRSGSPHR